MVYLLHLASRLALLEVSGEVAAKLSSGSFTRSTVLPLPRDLSLRSLIHEESSREPSSESDSQKQTIQNGAARDQEETEIPKASEKEIEREREGPKESQKESQKVLENEKEGQR
eukprot:CAMPEP_0197854410 /NCGR_PEP_ID=MMETSP1438-20131217/24631_1 /TAXON_ID=1461541 /ORGANISM="Pterosperma sp., Strain CCMP1384" /LENGTH=113 /DNA_ID=CAMNT_0043469139 /DNA_START=1 /DNA_END=339 /DNA_ORIENTATION=-